MPTLVTFMDFGDYIPEINTRWATVRLLSLGHVHRKEVLEDTLTSLHEHCGRLPVRHS